MKDNLSLSQINEKIAYYHRKMEKLDLEIERIEREVALLQEEPNYVRTKKKIKEEEKVKELPL